MKASEGNTVPWRSSAFKRQKTLFVTFAIAALFASGAIAGAALSSQKQGKRQRNYTVDERRAIGEVLNRVCDVVIWLMSAKAIITLANSAPKPDYGTSNIRAFPCPSRRRM
jgi:hypothetical protein